MIKVASSIFEVFLLAIFYSCSPTTDKKQNAKLDTASNGNSTLGLIDSTLLASTLTSSSLDFGMDKGKLNKNSQTLDLTYQGIMCTCAQWAETKDSRMHQQEPFYLEPADSSITNAQDFYDGRHLPRIKVTGSFYQKEGYPKDYNPLKGSPRPAKVFRYFRISEIRR